MVTIVSKRILFMIFAFSHVSTAFASSEIKIECPYDDFAEESWEFSIVTNDSGTEVKGDLMSAYNGYEVDMIATKITAEYKSNSTNLKDLYFEGINKDGELFGFKFEASEKDFESGIGYTKSNIVGNRIFICSQMH